MAAETDEDEWEYIYDENETETFYVAVDLSSSLATLSYNHRRKQTKSATSTGKGRLSRRRTSVAEDDDENENDEDVDGDDDGGEDNEDEDEEAAGHEQVVDGDGNEDGASHENERIQNTIQILDLHSPNPIIAYKNRVFSCSWNTLIGTGIYLTAATKDGKPSNHQPGNHSLSNYVSPIISSSNIVIRGKPVTLHAKPGYSHSGLPDGASSTTATANAQSEYNNNKEKDADLAGWYAQLAKLDLVGPGQSNDPLRQLQLPFLARFAKLKRERGETEGVTYLAKNPLRVARGREEVAVSEAVVARTSGARGGRGARGKGRATGAPSVRGRGRAVVSAADADEAVETDVEMVDAGPAREEAASSASAAAGMVESDPDADDEEE